MATIAELKNKRAEMIANLLPEDVNDMEPMAARLEVIKAENHPDVLDVEADIHALRLRDLGMDPVDIDSLKLSGPAAMQRAVQQLMAGR